MKITYQDEALRELHTTGKTKDKRYKKLPVEVIKSYIKKIGYLEAAPSIEALWQIKSLHYEKKQGNLKDIEVVWINTQYRLHFISTIEEGEQRLTIQLLEISKHYEK